MCLDTNMISIHPHFTIKDGKMDQCIALLEEILVMTKANEPDYLHQYIYVRFRQGICK